MEITVKTTLAELIDMAADKEKEQKTPTSKALREGHRVVADCENCTLYDNGYVVYENLTGRTVLWLKDCISFTYRFDEGSGSDSPDIKKDVSLPDGYLAALPWVMAVTVVGDHRIEANCMNRSGSRKGTRDYGSDDRGDKDGEAVKAAEEEWQKKYNWKYDRFGENPETAYIRKLEQKERLDRMTEKQREVFILYYRDGYKQEEIGDMLGIGRTTVEDRLEAALKKMKKSF